MSRTRSVLLALLPSCGASIGPRCSVPADGKITLPDYGYRDWGPDLLHYRVDAKRFPPDRVEVLKGPFEPAIDRVVVGR